MAMEQGRMRQAGTEINPRKRPLYPSSSKAPREKIYVHLQAAVVDVDAEGYDLKS